MATVHSTLICPQVLRKTTKIKSSNACASNQNTHLIKCHIYSHVLRKSNASFRLATPFLGTNRDLNNHSKLNFGNCFFKKCSTNNHIVSACMFINPTSFTLASSLFTFGTIFVMPFYSLMIFAPKWETTKKVIESSLPFVFMSCLYLFLLCLSWKRDTFALMFSSKYLLPELLGITKMFSCPLTISSAWIHLLCVDLFSARHVFLDGSLHNIETRHSIVLCLMFGPIGILCHLLSKAIQLYKRAKSDKELLEEPNFA